MIHKDPRGNLVDIGKQLGHSRRWTWVRSIHTQSSEEGVVVVQWGRWQWFWSSVRKDFLYILGNTRNVPCGSRRDIRRSPHTFPGKGHRSEFVESRSGRWDNLNWLDKLVCIWCKDLLGNSVGKSKSPLHHAVCTVHFLRTGKVGKGLSSLGVVERGGSGWKRLQCTLVDNYRLVNGWQQSTGRWAHSCQDKDPYTCSQCRLTSLNILDLWRIPDGRKAETRSSPQGTVK